MSENCSVFDNTDLPIFSAIEADCATTVMLKILDGKCKMLSEEKIIMEALYDALKHMSGERLPTSLHQIIATARQSMDENLREHIYEQRLFAEIMISRPVMKKFKARLRQTGILTSSMKTDV